LARHSGHLNTTARSITSTQPVASPVRHSRSGLAFIQNDNIGLGWKVVDFEQATFW
jgi:hypothetical protein